MRIPSGQVVNVGDAAAGGFGNDTLRELWFHCELRLRDDAAWLASPRAAMMDRPFAYARQKLRKQVHKYWQRSLPVRQQALHPRFPRFAFEYAAFRVLSRKALPRFHLRWADRLPCLDENTRYTQFDPDHTYPLAWAARAVAQILPELHVDVASDISFSAVLSAYVPVERFSDNSVRIDLRGLNCRQASLAALPLTSGGVKSLSCLGVAAHLGLGRYGEPLDPDADLRVMAELSRVLSRGGTLLFSAPVGKPRIRFNARRIYSFQQVTSCFSDLDLAEFSLVDDEGRFFRRASPSQADAQEDAHGCWRFVK